MDLETSLYTKNIETFIYHLRQYVHFATRYPISKMETVTDNSQINPYRSICFNVIDVTDIREIEEKFLIDIRKLKYAIINDKLKFALNDLYKETVSTYTYYFNWYNENKIEIESLSNDAHYFHYKAYFDIMETAQNEIISLNPEEFAKIKLDTEPQKESQTIDIDSTLHQQFLIFHYILKHLEVSSNSVDKTQIARFIQFATQRQVEARKIQNTSIYKLIENPFNGYSKDNGTAKTNLQKVRALFESIGLKGIAEIINKDII